MKFAPYLILVFCAIAYAKHEQYIGWKSYYVGPLTESQLKPVGSLLHEHDVDTLSHPVVGREGLVLVKPARLNEFLQALEEIDVPYKVHSDDVKTSLDIEDQVFAKRKAESFLRNGKNIPYDAYQDYDVIEKYIIDVAAQHPDIVTLVTPAETFEGRQIRYLKISTSNFEDSSKPVIFIDGGIHAREWISPPSVTWAIDKLVGESRNSELLTNYDWILLPVVNPDGYQYTHTNTRFWRKTKSTNQHYLSNVCPGVDGNRNYDFFWGTVGVGTTPCSDTYPGARIFSEVETRVVRDIIRDFLPRMPLYITIHSYGSMILYPWGHDGSDPETVDTLREVAVAMADVIDGKALPNFPKYLVGNAVNVLGYGASGASEDYAHQVGVPLSYTFELPGLGWGYDGFHLDPIYIQNVCEETWDGIIAGVKIAGEMFRRKSNQQ